MIKIILLDVDGVLVQPRGYRAALRSTVNYFIEPQLEVQEEWLTDLEKRGIYSEWDMVPLLLASYWAEILSRQPMQNLPSDIFSAATEINRQRNVEIPAHLLIPDFPILGGRYPAESALEAGCFSSIPHDLRRNLLSETRNLHKSHTMQIFQHFTLGSKQFTETYHLPAEFEIDSFLLRHDTSTISDAIWARLCQPNYHLAAFTSRPSRPPLEIRESIVGYAPEAELALELAGLPHIPLIAFGKLEYLASQYGIDPATLVKPSPVQALAAVLAAWTGEEWTSLQAANHWRGTGTLNGMFDRLPKIFEWIIVEDTMGGIYSALSAGEILKKAGFDVRVHAIGLTSGNAAKASAFERAGVSYFPDWESLINAVGL